MAPIADEMGMGQQSSGEAAPASCCFEDTESADMEVPTFGEIRSKVKFVTANDFIDKIGNSMINLWFNNSKLNLC